MEPSFTELEALEQVHQKVLILSPAPTHPQSTGTSARILQMASLFQRLDVETHFFYCPAAPFGCKQVTEEMRSYWGERGTYLEAPGYLSRPARVNVWRWLYKIASLVLGHPPRGKKNSFWVKWMEGVYHHPDFWCPAGLAGEINRYCLKHTIRLVLCEYFIYSKIFEKLRPGIRAMVDTIDVFSNRNERMRQVVDQGSSWLSLEPADEKRSLLRADGIIAIQEEEREVFEAMLEGKRPVHTLDFLDPPCNEVSFPVRGASIGLVAADNPVNQHGFDWFYGNVWPEIMEAVPGVRLRVAGGLSRRLSLPNVETEGYVEDLQGFIRECTLVINPVLAGTGLKIKSLDALRNGQALVSTINGADGIRQLPNAPVVATDDQGDFAEACVRLLTDREHLKAIRAGTIEFYRDRYTRCVMEARTLLDDAESRDN